MVFELEWWKGKSIDVADIRPGHLVDIEAYGPVAVLEREDRDGGVVYLIGTPRGRVYGPFLPGTRLPLLQP